MNSKFSCPRPDALSLAVKRDVLRFSVVAHLLKACCPLAVHGPAVFLTLVAMTAAIMPVVVNPVNGQAMPDGLATHVSEEVYGCVPATAYPNTAPPVVFEVLGSFVVAPLFHIGPTLEFVRTAHPVGRHSATSRARTAFSASEVLPVYNGDVPALALALPKKTDFGVRILDNSQLAIDFSSFVFRTKANSGRIAFSHVNLLNRFVWSEQLGCYHTQAVRIISCPLLISKGEA